MLCTNGGIIINHKFFPPTLFAPEGSGFSVYVPDIAGCLTQGDTLAEIRDMVQEDIDLMLEDIAEKDYPSPSNLADIAITDKQFVIMVSFDKLAYDKKYNAKAVKKALSIPAWLNKMAIEKNNNFSQLLQNALIQELDV